MSDTREKAKRDFRQEATDLIVSMLEKGTAPWQRPWDKNVAATALAMPYNGATGRAYTGGNALYLMAKGMQQGYDDPRWMTYEQAQSKGWQVRKGEKATYVEFWQFEKTEKVKDPATGKEVEQRVKLDRPIQRLYAVFNAKQIDGVPPLAPRQRETWQAIEAAERALKNSGAKINHRGTEAFYHPGKDEITMPPKEAFPDQAAYYGTALHELAHWTGHESRLNRDGITGGHAFGSEGYAREELRAEMASVFMQAELGVPHDIERHAAYVDSWIAVLKKDKNELFRAAKDAGQAADYVIELSKHRELTNELADSLVEQAATNTASRYGGLTSTVLNGDESQRLLAAAEHRELARLANEHLANPEDRAKLMQRSQFAQAATDKEKAQELDSALRELDYIENLPLHVAMARNDAKDKRVVELRDLEAVAYVDRQSGDLTIPAKSPEALAVVEIGQRARFTPNEERAARGGMTIEGVVVDAARTQAGNIRYRIRTDEIAPQDGQPQEWLVYTNHGSIEQLPARGVEAQKVSALMSSPEQRKEQLSESFKDVSRQAKELLGEKAKTFPAQLAEGFYKGPIIAESDHHVLQQVSPTTTVAHMKTAFADIPKVDKDQPVQIPYNNGKAKAMPFTADRGKEKTRSLSR
jgi:antirestriction protein ArdC